MTDDKYICPFCAFMGRIADFRLKKASGGYSRKRYKCPDCGQIMKQNTLKRKITAGQWAEWLYASIRVWNKYDEKFYDRISFEKLVARVKRYGIASEFWEAWREAKTYNMEALIYIVDNAYIPDKTQLKLVV